MEKTAYYLETFLKNPNDFNTLYLNNHRIGDEGARKIGEILKTITSLTSLNLWNNRIGDEGGKWIGEGLKTNTSLTSLDLRKNDIGEEGGKWIGEGLKTNTSLTSLDLWGNRIGEEGGKWIMEGLKTNTFLTSLDLDDNSISYGTLDSIKSIIEKNKQNKKIKPPTPMIKPVQSQQPSPSVQPQGLKPNSYQTQNNLDKNSISEDKLQSIHSIVKKDTQNSNVSAANFNGKEEIGSERMEMSTKATMDVCSPTYVSALAFARNHNPEKGCYETVTESAGIRGEFGRVEEAAKDCKRFVKSTKPDNLSFDDKFAIALYSYNLPSSKSKDNFYFILNEVLRKRSNEEMEEWRGYLYYFFCALDKLPDQNVMVYRGIVADEKMIEEEYSQGRSVHWSSFSSATIDIDVAKSFAKASRIIFRISLVDGKDINKYSMFKAEKEILLGPNMKFLVTKGLYEENGYKYVDLFQKKKSKTYVF